jgi:hypothetical protein
MWARSTGEFKDAMLRLTLPKLEEANQKQIEVIRRFV